MFYNQSEYDIKCEWGLKGVDALAEVTDVFIVVDILSFSTCVEICVSNGAEVYPYEYKNDSAEELAVKIEAELAVSRKENTEGKYTLSPKSLLNIPNGTKLVLPSPNGSAISFAVKNKPIICGCLRNAKSAADYAMKHYKRISLIPAGEKWEDGSMRFAIEDLLGAGAIISYLKGSFSPESKAAMGVFESAKNNLFHELKTCSSGKELIERNYEYDVDIAAELNVSNSVPVLIENRFVNVLV